MSTLNYVIATYSGHYNGENKSLVLRVQLQQLYDTLVRKRDKGLQNIVSRITVVCPEPRHTPYPNYYQEEKWIQKFQEVGTPIVFQKYVVANQDHSYDQWLQGYMGSPRCDYNLFIEDDYCVFGNDSFDTELVELYRKTFPDDIGYLATLASANDGHKFHATISNGIISSKTFDRFENPLTSYYAYKNGIYPQLRFSFWLMENGVPLRDFSRNYKVLIWHGLIFTLEDRSESGVEKTCLAPVQCTGLSTRP